MVCSSWQKFKIRIIHVSKRFIKGRSNDKFAQSDRQYLPVLPFLALRSLNPLNPDYASKHHLSSLKNDLIPYTPRVLNEHFNGTVLLIKIFFFHFPPTSSHFYSLQVENCDSNSRLVVNSGLKGLMV